MKDTFKLNSNILCHYTEKKLHLQAMLLINVTQKWYFQNWFILGQAN